jgi:predicted exporter
MSTLSPSTRPDAGTVRRAVESIRAPAETLAFWAAVLLPFCYIPLLYSGVSGADGLAAFAGLLVAHVVALFLGHDHNRDAE